MWFLVTLLACNPADPPAAPEPAPAAEPAPAPGGKPGPASDQLERTWERELAEVDRRLKYFQDRMELKGSDDKLGLKQQVSLLLDRAQLTGDYEDYVRAEAVVEAVFSKADAAADGPHNSAFAIDMALHRYASARDRLQFVYPSAGPKAQLDFAVGDYAAAGEVFERMAKSKQPEYLARLAIYRWKTGDLDAADELLVEAAAGYHGRFHRPEAWYQLHRGILDLERGEYHDAMAHYLAAKEKLDDYWLIDEHIAEIHLLQGNLDKAHSMYEDLVERTGNPEFMDRLAETLEQQGEAEAAEAMVARARAAYEARLAQFPEATWGHAIDHWITWGDPDEALEMARKNAENRPNGDAKLSLVHALMKAGKLGEARKVMKEIQASPFDVPEVAELAEALKKAQ